MHDGDGDRHYKSFIFGSKTADAEMQKMFIESVKKL